MSYYGDLLSMFPELIKEYQLFTMEPLAGGGYRNRTNLFKKRGAFIKGAKSAAAIQGEARVTNEAGVFYCYELKEGQRTPQGIYFEQDNQIFILNDDQIFAREAGFAAYGCQLVQGPTDRQVENLKVENRTITDYPI
jgi:hypothetical protein